MTNDIKISRDLADRLYRNLASGEEAYQAQQELRMLIAAPVVESQEPVAADIAHDRAYRNGLMAGFQFGISGNEKGYALEISNFNSEINKAKKNQPASVAVVLPERRKERPFGDATTTAEYNEAKGFNLAIDKVKELNQ